MILIIQMLCEDIKRFSDALIGSPDGGSGSNSDGCKSDGVLATARWKNAGRVVRKRQALMLVDSQE